MKGMPYSSNTFRITRDSQFCRNGLFKRFGGIKTNCARFGGLIHSVNSNIQDEFDIFGVHEKI